ncbi:MAG: hypothetical protein ABIR19_11515 [Ginsengibacter sp.]
MSVKHHAPSKVTAVLAIVFLIPPLIFFILWSSIGLQSSGLNAREKISRYLEYFPQFMQNLQGINLVSIACCLVATYFAARSFRKRLLSIRILMFLTVIAAMFIILFDIYQMV